MKRRLSKSVQELTAVYEHINSTQHLASLDDFEIIGRENSRNGFLLRVKESLLIKKHRPDLNDSVQSTPLMLF